MNEITTTRNADLAGELARQQSAIVQALNRQGPVPPGFEPSEVEVAAESLTRKRQRSVQKFWPGLARGLGDAFTREFSVYASQNPPPVRGANVDGFRFAQWLKTERKVPLPESAKVEFAISHVSRGFPLRLLFLPDSRRMAFVFRLGGSIRVGQFTLPRLKRSH